MRKKLRMPKAMRIYSKMKIALKEADETEYWLFLCQAIEGYPKCNTELLKLNGILKILNKIISSSKKK